MTIHVGLPLGVEYRLGKTKDTNRTLRGAGRFPVRLSATRRLPQWKLGYDDISSPYPSTVQNFLGVSYDADRASFY